MAICSDGADVTSLPHELSREFLLYHGVCPLAVTPSGELRVAVASEVPERRIAIGCDDLHDIYDRTVERIPFEMAAFG